MTNSVVEQGRIPSRAMQSSGSGALSNALSDFTPPLLFALRMWASVCLALYVAFSLELQNPYWAGASAAIVCQPQLGASLRKGWFRMIGTVVGAIMIVVLTACFPQDRIAFLALLAVWCGLCAFAATLLRNFASYSASLAGYTAAIIAADTLGATGGASTEVFMLAIWRGSEICIGIACAGVVLAGTDLGGAQRRLAKSLADLTAEIAGRFLRMLEMAGPNVPDTQTERREFVRRVIALDPVMDQVLGESSHVRYHAPTLEKTVHGLFASLVGWRGVAAHLSRSRDETDHEATETILCSIPSELASAREPASAARWMADPIGLRRLCDKAVQKLIALPAGTPSLRLLADETAKILAGMMEAFDGLALLVDARERPAPARDRFRLSVADYLPALINGARAFVMIGAVELFWVATAWPSGAFLIVIIAVANLLLSPRGDLAYRGAIAFAIVGSGTVLFAAVIKFAVLPAFETFPGFCLALGLFFLPVGFVIAKSQNIAVSVILGGMAATLMPLLTPTNQMVYDTQQFYNLALAMLVGCCIAPVIFSLLPPLSPELRARRLLAFAVRDLRRLATVTQLSISEDWESRMYGRFAALPDNAEPLQRAQLLAALSVGSAIVDLRRLSPSLGIGAELETAIAGVAQGNSAVARTELTQLDHDLASRSGAERGEPPALRARARILVLVEALAQHSAYFDGGGPA
jgi:uncharacterized membrane protein YccC